MMVVFIALEPLVIGEIDESLAVRERALATLQTFSDNEVPGYFVNILGVVFMLGTISGLALLGKSLDGNGAALGTVSSLIFTAVLAIPVIALGLSLSAGEIFAEGYTDTAVSVELMAESTFMGFPIFLGLGYILLGLGLGVVPIIGIVVLDALIVKSGLSEIDLFAGAELRETANSSMKTLLIQGVFKPVITMIFITGYVLNTLIKKNNLAIPGNGILYSSMNFSLGIGYLGFGIIAAGLARFTGSLIPAILFSIGCALAKYLILTNYPRIITIMVFLM